MARTGAAHVSGAAEPGAAGPAERHEFPARLAMLAPAATFVEQFCARHAVARNDALRLLLVLEELVTNTVVHGHGVECDAPIAVQLLRTADGVRVLYEDTAPPFDPRPAMARADEPADVPRVVGGLGTRLVGRLAHEVRYAYVGGRNRVSLALACAEATPKLQEG